MITSQSKHILAVTLAIGVLLWIEPALTGNKFETIGGGISGSNRIKLEYMRSIALAVGSIMMLGGVLSIAVGRKNALMLSFTMWKESATIFFILGILAFVFALLV